MKLHKLYGKAYTEAKFKKGILGKTRIAADKAVINRLVVKGTDPKTGKPSYSFDVSKVTDKKTVANLNRIAKDIRKQKGRVNVVSIALALAALAAFVLLVALFRNVIARKGITMALEGAFGARCDIERVDVGFFDTSFRLEGLAVANKDEPMKNLFEIGEFSLEFDLLELTRAKLVADEVRINGITWNTDRTVSGSLPPNRRKKAAAGGAPNPVLASILAEAGKVTSGISIDSGLAAVQDQLDPVKIIERERERLASPAVVEKISDTIPKLTEKWETKGTEARKVADSTKETVAALSSVKVNSIKTVDEARALVAKLDKASKDIKESVSFAKTTSAEADRDAKTVKSLTAEAESALAADKARLVKLADGIKSINVDTGKGIVSSAFNSFFVSALGKYYPYFDKGLSLVRESQASKKRETPRTPEKKNGVVERLPGRDITFGTASLPSVLFREIELSAEDAASGISGNGIVRDLTNDADRLGKPVSFELGARHGKMAETVSGVIDARTGAETIFDASFGVKGYALAIDAGSSAGMPSIAGDSTISGKIAVRGTDEVSINSRIAVANARMSVNSFSPSFLYRASKDALAGIRDVTFTAKLTISPKGEFSLAAGSDIDERLNRAVRESLAGKVAEVKAAIRKEANSYVDAERKKYLSRVNAFTASSKESLGAIKDIEAGEKSLDAKKKEAEKRLKELVAGAIAPKGVDSKNPAGSLLKKLP